MRSRTVRLSKQLFAQLVRDDALGLAAELAYRFFLAIFPFFVFLASVGAFFPSVFRLPNPARHFVELLSQIMPPSASEVFKPEVEHLIATTRPGVASLAVLGAVLIATSGTNAMIKALNRAHGVDETRPFVPRYLLAVAVTLVAGSAMTVAFLLFIEGWIFGAQAAASLGFGAHFLATIRTLYWPAVAVLLIAAMTILYRAAPNVELRVKWVIPGAIVFTIGWLISTAVFAAYVQSYGSYRFTYGALGGVVVLLLWLYLTGLFFILGAELNDVVHDWFAPEEMEMQRARIQEKTARHFETLGLGPGRRIA